MNATLTFVLPEEEEDHRAALEGAKWKGLALAIDQDLRSWLKYGHQFKTPDEAIQTVRDSLYGRMHEANLGLFT